LNCPDKSVDFNLSGQFNQHSDTVNETVKKFQKLRNVFPCCSLVKEGFHSVADDFISGSHVAGRKPGILLSGYRQPNQHRYDGSKYDILQYVHCLPLHDSFTRYWSASVGRKYIRNIAHKSVLNPKLTDKGKTQSRLFRTRKLEFSTLKQLP
jgi:hypothetical protein